MSDKFEQWFYGSKYTQVVYPNQNTKRIALDGWNAALSSLQGEAVAWAYERATEVSEGLPIGNRYGGFERTLSYNKPKDHPQFRNARPLFTYPPDASAKIAELESKLAEVEKDAERYQAIKKNVEEVLVSPRTTHLDEYGLVDIRMKWQIKPTLISYTCVGESISFDEASDMLVAAIQESKKGGVV